MDFFSHRYFARLRPVSSPSPKWLEETSNEWAETKTKVVKFSYTWNIENFDDLWEVIDTLKSPEFPADTEHKVKWQLELTKDKSEESDSEFLSLALHLSKWDGSCDKAYVKCSILNHEETLQKKQFSMSHRTKVTIKPFIYHEALFDKSKNFLTNNMLTIFSEICLLTDTVCSCGNLESIKVSDSTMSADFAKIFDTKNYSDVIIVTEGGQEIPAHKNILTARSEVFEAMFNNEMVENQESRLTINDFEHEVVNEMLRFIYTDTAPKLDKMCKDLLMAANKYLIERLKNLCESFLLTKLTVDNAAETFLLANFHNANQLQAQALQFISDRADCVKETDGWKEMLQNHPTLVKEHFNPKIFPVSRIFKPNYRQYSCEKCG